jgi:hypothetical protein
MHILMQHGHALPPAADMTFMLPCAYRWWWRIAAFPLSSLSSPSSSAAAAAARCLACLLLLELLELLLLELLQFLGR